MPLDAAKPATLLVVDDDAVVRGSIAAYLEDSGYTVLQASCGTEAEAIFKQKAPDVLICDLRMPRMDGIELIRHIAEAGTETPIIVISGAGVMGDVIEALRLGALDYLTKPIEDLEVLEFSVRRCLDRVTLSQENLRYQEKLEIANQELEKSLRSLQEDQRAGRQIQKKMLPKSPLNIGSIRFSRKIIPSLYLSGDFVDYFQVDKHHTFFYLADVSGHGASSAFVTTLLRFMARNLLTELHYSATLDDFKPSRMLSYINQGLINTDIEKHATMVIGLINEKTEELLYSVGGHLPLPLFHTEEHTEYLRGTGQVVGLFEDAVYEDHSLKLPPRFSLMLFSDGVLEVLPGESIKEKEQNLIEIVSASDKTIEGLVTELKLDTAEEIQDDVSFLLLTRNSL